MTDYKNLKLIASSSPHIRSKEDTRAHHAGCDHRPAARSGHEPSMCSACGPCTHGAGVRGRLRVLGVGATASS